MHKVSEKNYLNWTPLWSILDNSDPATSITWSAHLLDINIDWDDYRAMIDYGAYNGTPLVCWKNSDLPIDPKTWYPMDPKSIWAFILTHTHNDHVGRVPRLVWSGYDNDIHLTSKAHQIFDAVMNDSLYVSLKEVERQNKIIDEKRKTLWSILNKAFSTRDLVTLNRYGITRNCDIKEILDREIWSFLEPIYTEQDLKKTFGQLKWYDYYTSWSKAQMFNLFNWNDLVRGRFIDAGHIYWSTMTLIELRKPNKSKIFNILWTWDLGRLGNRIYWDDPYFNPIRKPIDLLFTETTYGWRNHPEITWEISKMEQSINNTFWRWWQVLINCFSQTRQQEMLRYLIDSTESEEEWSIPKDTKIVFDSPLGEKILYQMSLTDPEYARVLKHPNIIRAKGKEAEEILKQKLPKHVFLMSGGMLQWGTAMKLIHYFDKNRKIDKNSKWAADEYQYKDIAHKWLVIMSWFTPSYTVWYKVANDPNSFNSLSIKLSSHADHDDIVDFITNKDGVSGVELRDNAKICMMHGSLDSMYAIKKSLEDAGLDPNNIIIPSSVGKTFRFKI